MIQRHPWTRNWIDSSKGRSEVISTRRNGNSSFRKSNEVVERNGLWIKHLIVLTHSSLLLLKLFYEKSLFQYTSESKYDLWPVYLYTMNLAKLQREKHRLYSRHYLLCVTLIDPIDRKTRCLILPPLPIKAFSNDEFTFFVCFRSGHIKTRVTYKTNDNKALLQNNLNVFVAMI